MSKSDEECLAMLNNLVIDEISPYVPHNIVEHINVAEIPVKLAENPRLRVLHLVEPDELIPGVEMRFVLGDGTQEW
jgi:hypothetical protein